MRIVCCAFIVLLLGACETDVIVPCGSDQQLSGLVCSEFRSNNGSPVGTVEYAYSNHGNSLITEYLDLNGSVLKTIRFTFKDGAVLTQRETVAGLEKVVSFSYNDQDSISSIAYFTGIEIDSIAFCDFENGKRTRIRVQAEEDVLRFEEYRYDSDGTLNRISRFDRDSSLMGYDQFEFFGNEKALVKKRTADHQLIHTNNLQLDQQGRVTLNVRRSEVGDTLLVLTNTYDQLGKLVEKTEVTVDGTSSIKYYYYQ